MCFLGALFGRYFPHLTEVIGRCAATISVLSAAVKRDEPPVGDKALAYTRGGPSLKDADNPEVVRTNFESVTRFLTEFAEYHAVHCECWQSLLG